MARSCSGYSCCADSLLIDLDSANTCDWDCSKVFLQTLIINQIIQAAGDFCCCEESKLLAGSRGLEGGGEKLGVGSKPSI